MQWSGGGGFGHYAWLLADALAGQTGRRVMLATRQGHELGDRPHRHTVVPLWPAAPRRHGVLRMAVVLVQRLRGWARLVWRVWRAGADRSVVVVQAADRAFELPFLWALRALRATVVLTVHNAVPHDSGRFGRLKMRVLSRSVDGVMAHTAEAVESVRRAAGRPVPALEMLHPTYAPLVGPMQRRHTAGRPFRVAHLGTIRPYKGFEVVARAVGLVQATHPGIEFAILGKPSAGIDPASLVAGLTGVSMDLRHVALDELVAAALAADVLVLGHRSSSESGIALLALAAGTPVVAPRSGPLERLVGSEPGWLYDPGDAEAAARAVEQVMLDTDADCSAVRARARALSDAVPRWDEAAARVVDFVAQLQGGAR